MAYGGGAFCPPGSIVLTANDPEPGCACTGGKFLGLAQPGQMPRELEPYISDAEFVKMMNDVNQSIESNNKCIKIAMIPSMFLWICLIGPILFFSCLCCYVFPKLKGDVERAMAPLTAKGLQVEWSPGKIRIRGLPVAAKAEVIGAQAV
eukprot:gnl/TRDRNA2_/TRDRNA2_176425_c0_seq37.p1 gnl/TRDRNA2_/TRDRNA2_176425_c0~~gnl/TRDRNA2_/TRDRNA2_176425_c0_seq37.p1  ORF type:complete len:149 (-),score=18.72 gnl/TRDRNA2_/TRDRNA2_176425_c0_seq37:195-641(-)